MSGKKNTRLDEMKARLDNPRRLTPDEYLQLLHEIRFNTAVALWIQTSQQHFTPVPAYSALLDKVHWLIDSVEKTQPAQDGVSIDFELPPVEASA